MQPRTCKARTPLHTPRLPRTCTPTHPQQRQAHSTRHQRPAHCTLLPCWQGEHTAAHKCCPAHASTSTSTPPHSQRLAPSHARPHLTPPARTLNAACAQTHSAFPPWQHHALSPWQQPPNPARAHARRHTPNPSRNSTSAHAPRLTPASTRRSAASSTQPCMHSNADC